MIPFDKIHEEVCNYYALPLTYIFQNTGKREVVEKRQIFHYLAKTLNPKISLATVGQYGLPKDHATVLHSCKTITSLVSVDKTLEQDIYKLLERCEKHKLKVIANPSFQQFKFKLSAALLTCKSYLELEAVIRRSNLIAEGNSTTIVTEDLSEILIEQ
jgi:hypothetical protein